MDRQDLFNQHADFIRQHTYLLSRSYQHWTGCLMIEHDAMDIAAILFAAPIAVVSHGNQSDPIFNYANLAAMNLFGMGWNDFTALPSRYSAEPMLRDERAAFLERVARNGFVDDYSGIRIAKNGDRFIIKNATVWNLIDEEGGYAGQAALIREWSPL